MVGLAGAVGSFDRDASALTDALCFFGDETVVEREDGDSFVAAASHGSRADAQPVTVESTGEQLWVWGNVYGCLEPSGRYVSKRATAPSLTAAEYCARRYERDGEDFVVGLNGSFVGILLDEDAGTVRFFTDRLGSRPIHYAIDDEGVVFSTQIQGICAFRSDELSFDSDYVTEYLSFERALGLKTPVAGVERAHPGAVTTVDLADRSVDVDVRWRPEHEPRDRSFSEFADRFTEVFESAVSERYDPEAETGVLLSGGSDSRLIMGAIPDAGVTGYHVNDWENREARLAARVADVSGTPFEFLERDGERYAKALEFAGRVSNYTSWFQHGHASGFAEELREACDVLMTGHYSDTLFKHNYLPYRGLIVPGTTIEVPLYVEQSVETTDDLVDLYMGTKFHNRKHLRAPPDYLRGGNLQDEDLRGILEDNVTAVGGSIDHHGVRHRSAHDAGLFGECYPLTNTAGRLFFDVMLQTAPFRDPFLDVRLLELMTELPVKYRLRKNLINASIDRIQPELGEIPHPNTNIALKRPFALHYLALQVNWLTDKVTSETRPRSYYTQGSWPNWDDLVRSHDVVKPALEEHSALLEATDWLDGDRLWEDYERHVAGENRFDELSGAISLLSNPATQALLRERAPAVTSP